MEILTLLATYASVLSLSLVLAVGLVGLGLRGSFRLLPGPGAPQRARAAASRRTSAVAAWARVRVECRPLAVRRALRWKTPRL